MRYRWKSLASPPVRIIPKRAGKRAVAGLLEKLIQQKIRQATESMGRLFDEAAFGPDFAVDPFGTLMDRADLSREDGVVTQLIEVVGEDGRVLGSWRTA